MSMSERLILSIVADHDGQLSYHELVSALRHRFEAADDAAFLFGRRSALDTVYELGALGALAVDEGEQGEDDPHLSLTPYGHQVVTEAAA